MSDERIHVIACGVLAIDVRHAASELRLQVDATYLPGGLHNNPKELRRRLQETIDSVSAANQATQIVVGYGICGRGAVGIHARSIPLAIPRVHDCIALFLGSDAAYRREFARYPGTYYVSAGWVQEKVQPKSSSQQTDAAPASPGSPSAEACNCNDPEYLHLVTQHGTENADAIQHFLSSWQRNYQRAAFISTGAPEHDRYVKVATDMAERFGWKYERLEGSSELLKKLLICRTSNAEVLWVPPLHVTVYDPILKGLEAVPVWKANTSADDGRDQVIEVNTTDPQPGDGRHAHLGLGIDAGGTYTDVALYEFAGDRVIQKAKALTTKWDYTIGISNALDQLDAAALHKVDLVSISTTLATNAIVEGRGQQVGLLIMPPYGLFHDEDISHRPIAVISGQLDIDGSEVQPIDPDQIRRTVQRMLREDKVGAFAVTGYASHTNPIHEQQVRQIIEQETRLPVTCGHEVSDQLNYRVRAQTAALNGRIIPILVSFLEQATQSLRRRGIQAPIMVVRSDGSLMSVQTARQRPIETILSGPAASVAGARYLAKAPSAIVVDVGGTTTDTAFVSNGVVRTTPHGARVGGWQTHVQALDMRTAGLGGDSLISHVKGELQIGPRRVGPISWLGARDSTLNDCFAYINHELSRNGPALGLLDIYTLNSRPSDESLTPRELRLVKALAGRPHCAHELSTRVQEHWWELLDLDRLEREHIVQRCGLTPTDVLHYLRRFERWNTPAASQMVSLFARCTGIPEMKLAETIIERFVHRLAGEALKKQLDDETTGDVDDLEASESAKALIGNWLAGGSAGMHVHITLKHPIIGIGAPVGHFLPAAAKLLETQAIIPEHADVANAIGAITSSVVINRRIEICPDIQGRFALRGVSGSQTFVALHEARAAAMKALTDVVTHAAREAGTSHSRIRFTIHDRVAPLDDEGTVFIAETVEATLAGRPDLNRI